MVRLEYYDENAEKSLIADVVDRYGVSVNILHGRIEFINTKPFGVLYISVDGQYVQIKEAMKYIETNAGRVEVVRDVI